MTTSSHDPNGYYAALGLSPGADAVAIKAGYRARVKAVHPDHNEESDASDQFQRVVEAYSVLRDVVRRAEYDATGAIGGDDDSVAPAAPFRCCRCNQVTAQPRYLVLRRVKSFLVWARVTRIEGIFCRDCADRAAAAASTATWAWGWWSPPGLVLTPWALLINLLGGSKPRHVNARILIRQARAFLAQGELDLAYAVARQAERYARVVSHRRQIEDILSATDGLGRGFRDRWRPWLGKSFLPQLLPLVALPLTIAVFLAVLTKPWDGTIGAKAGIVMAPPSAGDIRHVATDALKLRQAPVDGAPVLTLLDRFTTVTTLANTEDPEWVQVRAPSGVSGFVPSRSLYGGSADSLRHDWCAEHQGAAPGAGDLLLRRASGDHQLLIHNEGRNDSVVKLKTTAGYTMMAYYIPATYHLAVGGIPEGTYRIEIGTGSHYSRACGLFVDGMVTAQLPFTLTLRHLSALTVSTQNTLPEISLVAPPETAQPQPIRLEQFLSDD